MKILIATSIYPPDVGGPSQYARNMYETWKKEGHEVKVAAYRWEKALPPIVKHLFYLSKIIRKGWNADMIFVLDTFLAAVPVMIACTLMHKKYIVRTGGDLVWEWYVERTGDMVLLRDFYTNRKFPLSFKERFITTWSDRALKRAQAVIFSTAWQKEMFEKYHGLDPAKNYIVENFCGPALEAPLEFERTLAAWTRSLKWKNIDLLKEATVDANKILKAKGQEPFELYTQKIMYESSLEKMRRAWGVVLVSIGDISPNMIYDALMTCTPFIVTRELGIADRVKDVALFVDPLNKEEITEKIVWLSDPENRRKQAEKIRALGFTHSWQEIADEIMAVWNKVK